MALIINQVIITRQSQEDRTFTRIKFYHIEFANLLPYPEDSRGLGHANILLHFLLQQVQGTSSHQDGLMEVLDVEPGAWKGEE